jgi:HTTM domain
VRPLVAAWERFWFEPRATSTLALVRIAFGLVVIAWTAALLPGLSAMFGPDGLLNGQPGTTNAGDHWVWGLLGVFRTQAAVTVLLVMLLVSAVCLTVGYRTRIAAPLVFVGVLSFERRNPFVFDSGDALIRIIALYIALSPAGAALSLDRWRRARHRFWEMPLRTQWGLRLLQIQLSVIYMSTVWAKARGTTWNGGTAVSYAMRIGDIARFHVPLTISDSVALSTLMTYGTLAIEFTIAVLVWNRKARPWVLGLGVALHLGIDYSIRVGFFTCAMFVLYIAFIPPDNTTRLITAVRDRLTRHAGTGGPGNGRVKTPAPVADPVGARVPPADPGWASRNA